MIDVRNLSKFTDPNNESKVVLHGKAGNKRALPIVCAVIAATMVGYVGIKIMDGSPAALPAPTEEMTEAEAQEPHDFSITATVPAPGTTSVPGTPGAESPSTGTAHVSGTAPRREVVVVERQSSFLEQYLVYRGIVSLFSSPAVDPYVPPSRVSRVTPASPDAPHVSNNVVPPSPAGRPAASAVTPPVASYVTPVRPAPVAETHVDTPRAPVAQAAAPTAPSRPMSVPNTGTVLSPPAPTASSPTPTSVPVAMPPRPSPVAAPAPVRITTTSAPAAPRPSATPTRR